MTNFEKYNERLGIECSVDYWSDEAIDEAIIYLKEFSVNDWMMLSEQLWNRDVIWQARCAETMSSITTEKSVPILMELLNSSNEEVVEAAVDSLNSLAQLGANLVFTKQQLDILNSLVVKNGLIGMVASRLLKLS